MFGRVPPSVVMIAGWDPRTSSRPSAVPAASREGHAFQPRLVRSFTLAFGTFTWLAVDRRRVRDGLSWARKRSAVRDAWVDDGCKLPPDGGHSPPDTKREADEVRAGESQQAPTIRVALLLNRNARGVTLSIEQRLTRIVGAHNCFICCSLDDARVALQEVLNRGVYTAVACGGGDGTIASVMNLLTHELSARRRAGSASAVELPAIAVLRLGTGNGLAYVLGSRWDAEADLRRLLQSISPSHDASPPTLPMRMIALSYHSEGGSVGARETLCFFAGLGYDAQMLQDYVALRRRTSGNALLRPWVHSPFGYVLALLLRTLPATLRGEHVFSARVISLGEEAYYMDPRRGDWAVPHPKGSVLHDGKAGIVSVATVPFYGGGLRLFPFAGAPGAFMHLRISDIHPVAATLQVLPIWRGHFRNPRRVKDFLVREAVIEVDRAVPLQHSGELVGEVVKLHLQVRNDGQVSMVDFLGSAEAEQRT